MPVASLQWLPPSRWEAHERQLTLTLSMQAGEVAELWKHPGLPMGKSEAGDEHRAVLDPILSQQPVPDAQEQEEGGKDLCFFGGSLGSAICKGQPRGTACSTRKPTVSRLDTFPHVSCKCNDRCFCPLQLQVCSSSHHIGSVWWWCDLKPCTKPCETFFLDPYLGAVARQSGCGPRPSTTSRPRTARWSADAGRSSNAHPLYGSCPLLSDELFPDDSSDLTHGNVCF